MTYLGVAKACRPNPMSTLGEITSLFERLFTLRWELAHSA
jgi:hypothetical protein